MRAFWIGSNTSAPSNAAVNHTFLCPCPTGANAIWGSTESNANVLSEDVVITKLTAWVTTAPGSGRSWTFTIRDDGVSTAAAVTIAGSATSASWTGSVAMTALSVVRMMSTPAGTPGAPGVIYWTIEYETAGDFYLIHGGTTGTPSATSTTYQGAFGSSSIAPSASEIVQSHIVADSVTITRIAARARTSLGSGGQYLVYVRRGQTTDSAGYAEVEYNTPGLVSRSSPFSLTFSTYDFLSIKISPLGQPNNASIATCLTAVPNAPGDILLGASATATTSSGSLSIPPQGPMPVSGGANSMRVPACDVEQMAVRLSAAPGSSKARLFMVRSNGTDTTLGATVFDTYNAANPKTGFTHGDGNLMEIAMTISGAPAAAECKAVLLAHIEQGAEELVNTTDFFF